VTTELYLSTSVAAEIAGVAAHNLYSSFRRHGHYKGVVPRKGAAGRLSWPTEAFRASLCGTLTCPAGSDALVEHILRMVPEASTREIELLAEAWLGSEATIDWKPKPGQFTSPWLQRDAQLLGMLCQAFNDRLDQARSLGLGDVDNATAAWLPVVVRGLLRSLDAPAPTKEAA
jgi:hypothetical protein